jgi:hypothetical protein
VPINSYRFRDEFQEDEEMQEESSVCCRDGLKKGSPATNFIGMKNEDIIGDFSTEGSLSVYGDHFDPSSKSKDCDEFSMNSDDYSMINYNRGDSKRYRRWESEFDDDPMEEDK